MVPAFERKRSIAEERPLPIAFTNYNKLNVNAGIGRM